MIIDYILGFVELGLYICEAVQNPQTNAHPVEGDIDAMFNECI